MPSDSGFDTMFTIALVLIGAGFVLVIALIIRNATRMRQHGIDPTTLNADLAAKLMQSNVLAPDRSVEARLADLDRLAQQGTISADEHRDARRAVLSGGSPA